MILYDNKWYYMTLYYMILNDNKLNDIKWYEMIIP